MLTRLERLLLSYTGGNTQLSLRMRSLIEQLAREIELVSTGGGSFAGAFADLTGLPTDNVALSASLGAKATVVALNDGLALKQDLPAAPVRPVLTVTQQQSYPSFIIELASLLVDDEVILRVSSTAVTNSSNELVLTGSITSYPITVSGIGALKRKLASVISALPVGTSYVDVTHKRGSFVTSASAAKAVDVASSAIPPATLPALTLHLLDVVNRRARFLFDFDNVGAGTVLEGDKLLLRWWTNINSPTQSFTAPLTAQQIAELSMTEILLQTSELADGIYQSNIELWRGTVARTLPSNTEEIIQDSLSPLTVAYAGANDFVNNPGILVTNTLPDAVAGQVISTFVKNTVTNVITNYPDRTLIAGDITAGIAGVMASPAPVLSVGIYEPGARRNGLTIYKGNNFRVAKQTSLGTPSLLSKMNVSAAAHTFLNTVVNNPLNASRRVQFIVLGIGAGSIDLFRVKLGAADAFVTLPVIGSANSSIGGWGDPASKSFEVDMPTGTAIDTIEITTSGFFYNIACAVIPVHDAQPSASGDFIMNSFAAGTVQVADGPINILPGNKVIYLLNKTPAGAIAWTGVTEDAEADMTAWGSTASLAHSTTEGSLTPVATYSAASAAALCRLMIRGA